MFITVGLVNLRLHIKLSVLYLTLHLQLKKEKKKVTIIPANLKLILLHMKETS